MHGICCAADMDIETIGESFGIEVHTYDGPSFADWQDGEDGFRVIVLNQQLPEHERRADFFHELTHPLRHCGHQSYLPVPFVELQEYQAAVFQLAAAMPVYMLWEFQQLQTPHSKELAEEFRLPVKLVKKRIEQIRDRIIDLERMKRNAFWDAAITNYKGEINS